MNKNNIFKKDKTANIVFVYCCIFFILNFIWGLFLIFGSFGDLFEYTALKIKYILIGFLPALICVFVLFFLKKTGCKNPPGGPFAFILPILLLIWFLYAFVCFHTASLDSILINSHIPKRHSFLISKITNNIYRIEHFPNKIPTGATDYLFHFESSFQGYDIQYCKFKADKKYIEDILNQNKENIAVELEKRNVDDYYNYIPYNKIKDTAGLKIYILKNKNNDNNYTAGVITSESGEILFFSANFNLKIGN